MDVGCDHGGLPLTVLHRGTRAAVVAVDVNAPPCDRARSNARKLGLALDVRQGEGLDPVAGFVHVVSICGVGSATLIGVMAPASGRIGAVVAQPNDSAFSLRTWAALHGWRVVRERGVWDGGRYYGVLVLLPRGPGAGAGAAVAAPVGVDPVEVAWGVEAQVDRDALARRLMIEIERLSPLPGRVGDLAIARLAQERLANARRAGPA